MTQRRGFTLVEAATASVIVALVLVLLLPVARRQRLADGLQDSLNNVRQILGAAVQFHTDTGQMPMRGGRYTNGQLGGWDTWNYGGKNNRSGWASVFSGAFDESAYSRPLNQYLYPDVGIARPPGYVNVGSGSTWNFYGGTPSSGDRTNLQLPVFRSPGDHATYQGTVGGVPYGTANPALSCYDDVGTSYHLNMKWWDQPEFAGLGFTARFNAGAARIAQLSSPASLSTYVWMHDQIADLVVNFGSGTGEFGGANKSVCGFLDLHADYVTITPSVFSGPGYTFFIPNPPRVLPPPEDDRLETPLTPADELEVQGPP